MGTAEHILFICKERRKDKRLAKNRALLAYPHAHICTLNIQTCTRTYAYVSKCCDRQPHVHE